MKKKWKIDVCRGPVHIKSGATSVEVQKRPENGCLDKNSKNDFCQSYTELMDRIQDDGLIFAEGEKEVLETARGKVFCSYLLLKSYLGDAKVLSRHQDNLRFLLEEKKEQVAKPAAVINEIVEIKETKKSEVLKTPLSGATDF